MRIGRVSTSLLLLLFCWSTASQVEAQVQFVTSRAALGPNDTVDWTQLGPDFGTAPSPSTLHSVGGLMLTVSQPRAGFEIYRQNSLLGGDTGWGGSFTPGDPVLYTAAPGEGPVTIEFGSTVYGAGAQIESGQYGAYGGRIEAFDTSGLSLGSFSLNGFSDTLGDNSAIFLGVTSHEANISKIEFSVSTDRTADFGLNQLSVLSDPIVVIVPEPRIGALMLVGCSCMLAWSGKRRSR